MRLQAYSVIFWDFDGVIKDSMEVKSEGFYQLFLPYGLEVAQRVKAHHQANGGMSRLLKIPFYFSEFLGWPPDLERDQKAIEKFAQLSWEATINSPWVPGAKEYLRGHKKAQDFYIVTGTPETEIIQSCRSLEISDCFCGIFGAPKEKEAIIAQVMAQEGYAKSSCLMIGDATKDLQAARANGIDFLLRETAENRSLFSTFTGPKVADFTGFL